MSSNREKKRQLKAGVEKLRAKADWNPENFKSPSSQEQLLHLNQAEKTESVYGADEVAQCNKCEEIRRANRDRTALCDQHLREVMGF